MQLTEELLPWVRMLGILLVGAGIWLVARFLIRRLVTGLVTRLAKPKPGVAKNGKLQRQRAELRGKTIGTVADRFAGWTLGLLIAVTALAELGIDIAALLGITAIVGAAIGFGAQHMVRDFISGIFIVIEDQYGVGDWVQIGSVNGQVERIGLRITEVRDLNGTLWFIRNGEVNQVGNFSQHWANAVLDVSFNGQTAIARCEQLLETVASELQSDDEWQSKILAPVELLGVQALSSSQFTIRAVLRTAPSQQWAVSREFRRRLMARSKRSNIEILGVGR
jgi:small-conductance mechanosensitive channel